MKVESIKVTTDPIKPELIINSFLNKDCGALVTFIGTVRNISNDGKPVTHLSIEPVDKNFKTKLRDIASEIAKKYKIGSNSIKIYRRIGKLAVGEIALFVAVSAVHRQEAFKACEDIVDVIKKGNITLEKDIYR